MKLMDLKPIAKQVRQQSLVLSWSVTAPFMLGLPVAVCAAPATLADLENSTAPRQIIIPNKKTPAVSDADIKAIDDQLIERMLNMAKTSKSPAAINSYLDIADKIKYKNTGSSNDQAVIKSRVAFYEALIAGIKPSEVTDEMYYEIASNYDLLGDPISSASTLRKLLAQFPSSKYALEANFRVAEDDFASKQFTKAIGSYKKVIALGDSSYKLQAQYALGWSEYKDARFEDALNQFETLIQTLKAKSNKSKGETIMLDDSYKTMSLVFVQLGGAPALADYYKGKPLTQEEILAYQGVSNKYNELKQPFDVAKVYDSFIGRHPLAPETFEFNRKLLDVYEGAGYAQDIIKAKSDFVTRFDVNGAYFEQASQAQQQQIMQDLRLHIATLAKHYHAIADRNKTPADYKRPAELYQKLLTITNNPTDKVATTELLATTLYNSQQYQAALPIYEDLAYGNKGSAPEDAGYFALLCYQTIKKSYASKPEFQTWLDNEKTSSLRFIEAFPRSQNAYDVMANLAGEYLALKQFEVVADLSTRTLQLPNLAPTNVKNTTILLANTQFDRGLWKEAEADYRHVLALSNLNSTERPRYQNQLAATLYQQAKDLRAVDNMAEASKLYTAASNTTLDDDVKSDALYQAVDVYGKVPAAIPMLQDFYKRYPNHALSADILDQILDIQESDAVKDWLGASNTYMQKYARDYQSKKADALDSLWLAAESIHKTVQPASQAESNTEAAPQALPTTEISLYKQYINEPTAPLTQRIEAYERIYQDAVARQNIPLQQQEIQKQWDLYAANKAGSDKDDQLRLRFMAARARVMLDQPVLDKYHAIVLSQPLKNSIPVKKAGLDAVVQTQRNLMDLKIGEYVTRAQYTLGDSYADFYKAVLNAPKPEGLDELALEQYDIVLEEQTQPLKDKATEWHKANTALAISASNPIWDEWVAKSFDALAVISTGRYARAITPPTPVGGDALLQQVALQLKNNGTGFAGASTLALSLTAINASIPQREQAAIPKKGFWSSKKTPEEMAQQQRLTDQVAQAYWYKSYIQSRQGKFSDALVSLQSAQAASPNLKETYLLQGVINELYLDKPSEALQSYQHYNALDSDDKNVQKWINILQKQLKLPLTNFRKPEPVAPVAEADTVTTPETTVDQPMASEPATEPATSQPAAITQP